MNKGVTHLAHVLRFIVAVQKQTEQKRMKRKRNTPKHRQEIFL